jgi:hypothetical protein
MKYTISDFTYKVDDTGFQVLFGGVVLQTTKVNFASGVDIEKLTSTVEASVKRLFEESSEEMLDWILHWNAIPQRWIEVE